MHATTGIEVREISHAVSVAGCLHMFSGCSFMWFQHMRAWSPEIRESTVDSREEAVRCLGTHKDVTVCSIA